MRLGRYSMKATTTLIALSLMTVGLLTLAPTGQSYLPDLGWCDERGNDNDPEAWHRESECYLQGDGEGSWCVYQEEEEGDTPDGEPYHGGEKRGCVPTAGHLLTASPGDQVCYPEQLYHVMDEKPETGIHANVGACMNDTAERQSGTALQVCVDNRPSAPDQVDDEVPRYICIVSIDSGPLAQPMGAEEGYWCDSESSTQGGDYEKFEQCLVWFNHDGAIVCVLGWRDEGSNEPTDEGGLCLGRETGLE